MGYFFDHPIHTEDFTSLDKDGDGKLSKSEFLSISNLPNDEHAEHSSDMGHQNTVSQGIFTLKYYYFKQNKDSTSLRLA